MVVQRQLLMVLITGILRQLLLLHLLMLWLRKMQLPAMGTTLTNPICHKKNFKAQVGKPMRLFFDPDVPPSYVF